MSLQPCVLVFETRPRWAPELQRQFLHEEIGVRSSRAVSDIEPLLRERAVAVVVLAVEAAPGDCLQFLGRMIGRAGFPPVIAIGSPGLAGLEWPLRELGAGSFLDEAVSGEALADVCRRKCRGGTATPVCS